MKKQKEYTHFFCETSINLENYPQYYVTVTAVLLGQGPD